MTREPLPHEAHLFAEVYIDESSQNDHHFLVLGGIVIPRRLSAQFEADIINARSPRLPAVINSKGQLKEIGWKYISNGDFDAYKKVVDAYFSFAFRHLQNSMDPMHFYCSIIDTQIRGRRYTGKRGKFGFNREIYYHCLSIARRHRRNLFHVYPDDRGPGTKESKLAFIFSRGLRKSSGDKRDYAFRRVMPRLSHEVQALQISDILIGAVAYRLNRHYDAPNANRDKKMLCEYILKQGKAWGHFGERSFRERAFGNFVMWFRRHIR